MIRPKHAYAITAALSGVSTWGIGKVAAVLKRIKCVQAPVTQAITTGMKLFGENSNNNNSIARRMAANGVPKIAVIPAVAPDARRIFRSCAVVWSVCPQNDPRAPPVAIMGPSAPKGPPVPIEIADEMGLRTVISGGILLSATRIFSIASGIPCPRIAPEPNRAINPTTKPPITGITITQMPS